MAENENQKTVSSPFSLQSLCRLSLMPGFRISDCPNRRFTRDAIQHLGSDAAKLIADLEAKAPRPFTREAFHNLGHANGNPYDRAARSKRTNTHRLWEIIKERLQFLWRHRGRCPCD